LEGELAVSFAALTAYLRHDNCVRIMHFKSWF